MREISWRREKSVSSERNTWRDLRGIEKNETGMKGVWLGKMNALLWGMEDDWPSV